MVAEFQGGLLFSWSNVAVVVVVLFEAPLDLGGIADLCVVRRRFAGLSHKQSLSNN